MMTPREQAEQQYIEPVIDESWCIKCKQPVFRFASVPKYWFLAGEHHPFYIYCSDAKPHRLINPLARLVKDVRN